MVERLSNPVTLAYMELALVIIAILSSMIAYLLIRSARRIVDPRTKSATHLPSTPLTRVPRQRVRTLSII